MATRRKIPRRKSTRLTGFLPEPMQAFLARRIVDAVALSFGAAALATFAALASYSPLDPSWNSAGASGDAIRNWVGAPGAHMADILLQGLGAGSIVFGIVLAIWSFRLLRRRPIRPFWLRFSSAIAAGLLFSVSFARVPSGDWLVHPYMGGSGGALILDRAAAILHPLLQGWEHLVVALLAGVAGFVALIVASAVEASEWKRAGGLILRVLAFLLGAALDVFYRFTDWVRHYSDPSWLPPDREKPRAATEPKVRIAPRIAGSEPDPMPVPAVEQPQSVPRQPVIHTPAAAKSAGKSAGGQDRFRFSEESEWELPPVDLMQDVPADNPDYMPDPALLRRNAEMLANVLRDFSIQGDIVNIHPGPVVTLYELEPAPGVKTSRVISLSDDIARSMSAVSVRCAVIPGRNVIGIELPNRVRQTVFLRELLEIKDVQKAGAKLPLILGKDIGGQPIVADLTKMPHLLVAGTTGSGKSVAINTMILSLLYRLPPEKCRFIMIDPKMLELSVYDDIPHLLSPVVTEPGKAVVSLKWTVQEMEERYRAMSKLGVRNIEGYNARLREARKKGEVITRRVQTGFDPETGKPVYEEQPLDLTELPYIVVIVDEFADLMLVAGKDVEAAIQRLAQMARAAGIHLIMATQRPSVDVITGVIKANFPTRISFAVTSKIDSRTILGEGGAEQLLGMGDMLYMAAGGRIKRVHGPFVSDYDVENVCTYLKAQGEPNYIEDVTEGGDFEGSEVMGALFGEGGDGVDELYDQAVAIVARERKASTSFIQRCLQIGYNRAARIIEEMEKQGVVSKATATGKREVLISDFSDA